jgi:3-methyladenine DNA glycosylase Mpg
MILIVGRFQVLIYMYIIFMNMCINVYTGEIGNLTAEDLLLYCS